MTEVSPRGQIDMSKQQRYWSSLCIRCMDHKVMESMVIVVALQAILCKLYSIQSNKKSKFCWLNLLFTYYSDLCTE